MMKLLKMISHLWLPPSPSFKPFPLHPSNPSSTAFVDRFCRPSPSLSFVIISSCSSSWHARKIQSKKWSWKIKSEAGRSFSSLHLFPATSLTHPSRFQICCLLFDQAYLLLLSLERFVNAPVGFHPWVLMPDEDDWGFGHYGKGLTKLHVFKKIVCGSGAFVLVRQVYEQHKYQWAYKINSLYQLCSCVLCTCFCMLELAWLLLRRFGNHTYKKIRCKEYSHANESILYN